jgi:hypothetical protein
LVYLGAFLIVMCVGKNIAWRHAVSKLVTRSHQGCQMVYFLTKNPNLGDFLRILRLKMLVYLRDIWSILQPFGIRYEHLVHFGIFFPVLVFCTKKNLATLDPTRDKVE